LGGPMFLGV